MWWVPEGWVHDNLLIYSRCALHYRSTKAQTNSHDIYHKLRHALVYESDGFTKEIRLSYGGLTVTALSDRGAFHIEEKDGILNLYVPRDNVQREKCYLTQLPNELREYLLMDNSFGASKAFLMVIHTTNLLTLPIEWENGKPSRRFTARSPGGYREPCIYAIYFGGSSLSYIALYILNAVHSCTSNWTCSST